MWKPQNKVLFAKFNDPNLAIRDSYVDAWHLIARQYSNLNHPDIQYIYDPTLIDKVATILREEQAFVNAIGHDALGKIIRKSKAPCISCFGQATQNMINLNRTEIYDFLDNSIYFWKNFIDVDNIPHSANTYYWKQILDGTSNNLASEIHQTIRVLKSNPNHPFFGVSNIGGFQMPIGNSYADILTNFGKIVDLKSHQFSNISNLITYSQVKDYMNHISTLNDLRFSYDARRFTPTQTVVAVRTKWQTWMYNNANMLYTDLTGAKVRQLFFDNNPNAVVNPATFQNLFSSGQPLDIINKFIKVE